MSVPLIPAGLVQSQASRAQRIKVAKFGGLPCISNPILKIFAANHTVAQAAPTPIKAVNTTCHTGGGESEATRAIMAKVFAGGTKLMATLKVELRAALTTGAW